jgi:UDP-N-acetylglucosamine 2-epimerase (non-hydrolysing)
MKILIVFGTRPEIIKLSPLISRLLKNKFFEIKICHTGQHNDLIIPFLEFFKINLDFKLNVMEPNQDLFLLSSKILLGLKPVIEEFRPDYVMVHGDTTTAFISSLAAFYSKVKVIHIEAGLRTNNINSPFPEELNRTLISNITSINFAPTQKAKANLIEANITSQILVTGNTVIDALHDSIKKIKSIIPKKLRHIDGIDNKKIILFTGHRRENFGKGFNQIFEGLDEILKAKKNFILIYPIHPNPKVRESAIEFFKFNKSVYLVDPLDYPDFIWLLQSCFLVITDSGGIQEEAPSIGKPVIVTRDFTERQEAVDSGSVFLVGSNKELLVSKVLSLINNKSEYLKMAMKSNVYGDGTSSEKIIEYLMNNG